MKYNRLFTILNKDYLILFLILLLGLVLRLYRIDNPIADWHSWRQADTASVSRIYISDGISPLYPRYYDISTAQSGLFNPEGWRMVEFPIFNIIHALSATSIPFVDFVVWGRLVSVISALITGIFLYKIGRLIKDRWVGLLSAFFYLILPFNIYFTRVILPEPLAVLFTVISVWYGLKYTHKKSEASFNLYISAVFLALALLVKPYAVFLYFPIPILLIKKQGLISSLTNKKNIIAALIAVIPLLAWRLWISQYPEGIPFWKWAFNEDGIRFRPAFWRWLFGERIGRQILGVWGVILFAYGVLKSKRYSFPVLFMSGSFLYLIIVATANVKHDYYQTLIIPAIVVLLSIGAKELWMNTNYDKIISRSLVIFSIFMITSYSAYQIKDYYSINHPEIIEAGQAVQEVTTIDDLVIAPYNGDTAFLYQTKRFGWPVVDRSIPELIDRGADYYVSVNFDARTNQLMEDYEVVRKTDKFVILKLD